MASRVLIAISLMMLSITSPAWGQWSDDPAVNLAIADRAGDQVVCKVAATPGGGCYVAWFDQASGNYDVYLQHLDAGGTELWPHNGIPVSTHPQNSWLVDWDLIADTTGNAVLVFSDIRDGGDFDIHAYKISPAGEMLWGADGIALSDNADFEPAARVTEAGDGDLVFVWSRLPDVGDGAIMMQRLSPAGELRFAAGGIPVAGETGEDPGFCNLVSAGPSGVIVSWVRDISDYYSDRHLRAENFDSDGASVWGGPVDVYDEISLPIAYEPGIQPDGAGGALLVWHRSLSNLYNSLVQHLDADGNELFPHNGVKVSTLGGMHHIAPTMAHDAATGELYVFWDERNSGQSQWGIYGQRFSADGVRLWGESGREFLPVDTLFKYAMRALPAAGGAMLFWIDEPGGWGNDRVRGFRVDEGGLYLWQDSPIMVSSLLSGKSRLPAALAPNGMAIMIWEDDRNGSVDVYGQNVNPDGSLGAGGTGVSAGADGLQPAMLLLANFPNPFNPKTTIRFELPAAMAVRLQVFDLAGRRVRQVLAGESFLAGRNQIAWDGLDERGRALASGVYLCRLEAGEYIETRKMTLLK